MNKAITRYNHCKLSFLVDIINEHEGKFADRVKKDNFPVSLLLEFVEKNIVQREKVLNKSLREKVEKAYTIAYKHSNYNGIKDFTSHLDHISISNLREEIPELRPSTAEKEEEDKKNTMAEDTARRIQQMRKDRLKNIKMKQSNIDIDISANLTDVEKVSLNQYNFPQRNSVKSSTKTFENRNLSIDRLKKVTDSAIDRHTEKLKDKIKKNLEAMRSSQNKGVRVKTGDTSKANKKNITPIKSRNQSSLDKSKRELKTSTKLKRDTLEENKVSEIPLKSHSSKQLSEIAKKE